MKRTLLLLFKVGLSIGLVYYAFSKIDTGSALSQLSSFSWHSLAFAFAVLFVQCVFAALRLQKLLTVQGARCEFGGALNAVLIGAFFGQTLISFVGGDAMRVWYIARRSTALGVAARAVLCDRVFGFVGLILLIVLGLPFLSHIVTDPRMLASLHLLVFFGVAGFIAFLSIDKLMPHALKKWKILRFLAEVSSAGLQITKTRNGLFSILGLSFLIQLSNVIVVFILARGLSIELGLISCLVLVPPVLFLSMMPISFAGWGIRESAMVVALALVGISNVQSLALSISYGLCLVTISLPGGIIWFLSRNRNDISESADVVYATKS